MSTLALFKFFEQVLPIMSDGGVLMSIEHAQQASPSLARSSVVSNNQIQKNLDLWVKASVLSVVYE